jgi:uncharacterized membrane protein
VDPAERGAVDKRSRWWRREGKTAGAGERLVSVDEVPIENKVKIEKFQYLIDLSNRFLLFVLAFFGLISAGCIAGLPSTTCYALADAYTIDLVTIGSSITLVIMLYFLIWSLDYMNRNRETVMDNFGPKIAIFGSVLLIVIFIFLILFLSQSGRNVRLAIDHCFGSTTQHEQNLLDKIPLYRNPFALTPTLH